MNLALFLLCLVFSSPAFTMEKEEKTKGISNPLHQIDRKDLYLFPSRLFSGNFLNTKTAEEIIKNSLKGTILKDKGKFNEAIPPLEEAACHGNANSMVNLGDICEQKGHLEAALKWMIFGFQEHWLKTGEHLQIAITKFEALSRKYSNPSVVWNAKSPIAGFIPHFLKKENGFVSFYPKGKENQNEVLRGIVKNYQHELYLSPEEITDKEERFQDAYYTNCGNAEGQFYRGVFHQERRSFLKALHFYEHSKLPEAYYNIAGLYEAGHLTNGKPDYQKALQFYQLSGSSESYLNIAILYKDGRLTDGKDYKTAALYLGKSQHPRAYYLLGYFHMTGKIGLPDIETIEACFQRSDELYGKESPTRDAMNPQFGLLRLYAFGKDFVANYGCDKKKNETLAKINQKDAAVKRKLIDLIKKLKLSLEEESYYLGIISYYQENYEEAFIQFNQSLAVGQNNAVIIENIQEIMSIMTSQQNKKETETKAKAQPEKEETPTVSQSVTLQTKAAEPKPSQKERKENKKLEKTKRNAADIKEETKTNVTDIKKKRKSLSEYPFPEFFEPSPQQKIKYIFSSEKEKKEFENAKDTMPKLKELLKDIETKPWAIEGAGKPKVLKHEKYKGCLARRINEEDRLVYKVTGAGEISILSFKGHYKK